MELTGDRFQNTIFRKTKEDTLKFFGIPALLILASLFVNFENYPWLTAFTFYVVNNGHVHSTFIDVALDPREARKRYVWKSLLVASLLIGYVLIFQFQYFWLALFVATYIHNFMQGMGISLLFRGRHPGHKAFKFTFLALALFPFFIYNLKRSLNPVKDKFVTYVDFSPLLSADFIQYAITGAMFGYAIAASGILYFLIKDKKKSGACSTIYFAIVYGIAWIYAQNNFNAISILILSHGIPYLFLMQTRLSLTHSIPVIRKYASVIIFLVCVLSLAAGPALERAQNSSGGEEKLLLFFLFLPTVLHYVLDTTIWKRSNLKFRTAFVPAD